MRYSYVRYMKAVGGLSHNLVVVKQSRTKTIQHSIWDQNMWVFPPCLDGKVIWIARLSSAESAGLCSRPKMNLILT